MILNGIFSSAPNPTLTKDSAILPIYNIDVSIGATNTFEWDFIIPVGVPAGQPFYFGNAGKFRCQVLSGKHAPYYRDKSFTGTGLRWDEGSRVQMKLEIKRISATEEQFKLTNLTAGTTETKTFAFGSGAFDGNQNLFFNRSASSANSSMNIQYFSMLVNGVDLLDLTQDGSGVNMLTSKGSLLTIDSEYINNKTGTDIPNYNTLEEYVNAEIRKDIVKKEHSCKIVVNSKNVPLPNITIDISIENESGIVNISQQTDDKGEISFNTYSGNYTFDINAAPDYINQSNIPFNVIGSTEKRVQIEPIILYTNDFVNVSSKGTKEPTSEVTGTYFNNIDGTISIFLNDKYEIFYNLQKSGIVKLNTVSELRALPKGKIGNTAITESYFGNKEGGGLLFQLVSQDAENDGYTDNSGTIIISSIGDVWESKPKGTIEFASFGIMGDGTLQSPKIVKSFFDYASSNKLKMIPYFKGNYVIDSLTIEDKIQIDNSNYYFHIESNGATFKRYWQVKNLPMRLSQKTLMGNVTTFVDDANSVDFNYKKLSFTPEAGLAVSIGLKVHFVDTTPKVTDGTINTSSIGDYVIVASSDEEQQELHRVLTVNSGTPQTTEIDDAIDAGSTFRNRFFIATADFSKVGKIASSYDFSLGEVYLYQTFGPEFTNTDSIYFYEYSSKWDIADSTAELLITRDNALVRGDSVYKGIDENQWKLYDEGDIPTEIISILDCDYFHLNGFNFFDDRQDKDSLDLNKNVDNNASIISGDKTSSWDWNRIFTVKTNLLKEHKAIIENSKFKFANMNQIIDFSNTNFSEIDIHNCDFEDVGEINISALNPMVKRCKVRTSNLRIKNPYFQYLKNGGIWNQNVEVRQTGIENENYPQTLYRLSSNKNQISNVVFKDLFGRRKDENTSPFFNGKCLPRKNSGIFVAYGKGSTDHIYNDSYITLSDIKVRNFGFENKIEVDNDPITGTFLNQKRINIICNNLVAHNNVSFNNVDIFGQNIFNDPMNGVEDFGAKNVKYANCNFKANKSIKVQSIAATSIINISVDALEESTLPQHIFFGKGSVSLKAEIISNIISSIDIGIALNKPFSNGVFVNNQLADDYDTIKSLGAYDSAKGGKYTQRQPIITELDSTGIKKVVATFANLLTIETDINPNSGFAEKYKGGFIEVANEQVSINSTRTVNQRYSYQGADITNAVYWTKENNGSDRPLEPQIIENVQAPKVTISQILDENIQKFFYFRNVSNIEIGANITTGFPTESTELFKSKIYFEKCSFYQIATNTSRVSEAYSFLKYFTTNSNPVAYRATAQFPIVSEFKNCKYVSSMLGNNGVDGRNELIEINLLDVRTDNNNIIKWLHPQVINYYLGGNLQLDLDNIELRYLKDKHLFNIIIDSSTTGATILFGGIIYSLKGNYQFRVVHTYLKEIYVSSALELNKITGATTQTGTVLDLSRTEGILSNISASSSEAVFTHVNKVLGGKNTNLIKTPLSGGSFPTLTGATLITGSSYEDDTEYYMKLRFYGVEVEYYFSKKV